MSVGNHPTSALVRKSWTDLSRRPTRAVLTILTLALAVASFGILALPGLMNKAMSSEVAQTRLYDLWIPTDHVVLSPTQLQQLASLPNVKALTARSTFATRALIGTKRVDAEIWGVTNFTNQPVDQVITGARPGPGQVLVDVRDSMSGVSNAKTGDKLTLETADGSYHDFPVAGSARSMAFNQGAMNGHLILYADQATVQALGGFKGTNLLEFRLHNANRPAAQATANAVRSFLAGQPARTAFSGLPLIRTPGDWPLKSIFDSRAKVMDILIVLAVISAAFLLANTIRTLVAEQRREIGVMRSIGARARDIRNSYLRTAALLGAMGAVLGAVLGIGLTYVLVKLFARMIYGISPGFEIDWPIVGMGAFAGMAGTLLTAWPTLRRVLRMPVRDALAAEGLGTQFGDSRIDRAVLSSAALPSPIRIGVRNVARQKGRSLSTIVQIALAVGTLLGLLSLAVAVSRVTDQSWNVLNYDIGLSTQMGADLYSPPVVDGVGGQAGVAGVEAAYWSQMSYRGQTLYGLGVHARTFVREPISSGRWLSSSDEANKSDVAIVGSAAARRWHLHPGSRLTVATAGGPVTFTVIGVGASQANNGYNFYTPLATIQKVTAHSDTVNTIFVRAIDKNHSAIDRLAVRLEALLAASAHPSHSQVIYTGRATDKANASSMMVIVYGMGLLVVAISMLGLVNAITMSILERTREIGVLRCLGARARDLRRIFRTETLAVALVGFLFAIPLGWLVAKALQWLILHVADGQLPAPYTLTNLGIAFVGTVVLAVLVVIAPLRHATRLHPGDAIRYN